MALSKIWELEAGGSRQSLDAWGFTSASMKFTSQAADVLRLSASVADFGEDISADLVLDAAATLWRDDERVFSGEVGVPKQTSGGGGDTINYEILGPWSQLEAIPFAQTWQTWTRGKSAAQAPAAEVDHPRIHVGVTPAGQRALTTDLVAEVIGYASQHGANVALGGLMAGYKPRAFEMHTRSCAEVLRAIMAHHPDAVAWWDYSSPTPKFRMAKRSEVPVVLLQAGDRPVSRCDISIRHDLVPRNVICSYETIEHSASSDSGVASGVRFVVEKDSYPNDGIGKRTMFLTFPLTNEEAAIVAGEEEKELIRQGSKIGAELPRPGRGPQGKWHRQDVVTGHLPAPGENDSKARRWWIEHSPLKELEELGHIDQLDIAIPRQAAAGFTPHTLTIVEEVLPLRAPVNPNATVSAKSRTVADYPRELMKGPVPDWIPSVRSIRMQARATILLKSKTVADLPADVKAYIEEHLAPKVVTYEGTSYVLLERRVTFTATDALSKTYSRMLGVDYGDTIDEEPDGDFNDEQLAEAYTAARDAGARAVIVPGLAEALYDARSEAPVVGSWQLTEAESGGRRYIGNALAFLHPSRPEWAGLRCLVQSESYDIGSGTTSLRFGLARHLSPQRMREVMTDPVRAVQRAMNGALGSTFSDRQQGSREAGDLPQMPFGSGGLGGGGGGGLSGGGSQSGESPENPVVLPSLDDAKDQSGEGGGGDGSVRMWQVVDRSENDQAKIGLELNGATIHHRPDFVGPIEIVNVANAFSVGNGHRLYLEGTWDEGDGEWLCELKCDAEWGTDFWFEMDDEDEPDEELFRYPLANISSMPDPENPPADASSLVGSFAVYECAPDAHLTILDFYWVHPSTDRGYALEFPWPLPGAKRVAS